MHNRLQHAALRATLVVGALAFATTTAEAQRVTTPARRAPAKATERIAVNDVRTTGFVLSVYSFGAPGLTVNGPDVEGSLKTSFGPGGGVMVGYGFNPMFMAFASIDLAKQDASAGTFEGNFGLRHMEVGARVNLPYGNSSTAPYVMAMLGQRKLAAYVLDNTDDSEYELGLSGTMFGIGGGVQHAFSPTMAVDAGLELASGRFGHYDGENGSGSVHVNGTISSRLRVGVNWRPPTRRS
jgi:hypothetical protein